MPSGGETDQVRVPTGLVGILIGRGGENLRAMESETQAKIQIGKDWETTPDGYRPVTLVGSRAAIEAAKKLLESKVESHMQRDRDRRAGKQGEFRETVIQVHQEKVGLIIGMFLRCSC
jgi:far upstream element-binding protein